MWRTASSERRHPRKAATRERYKLNEVIEDDDNDGGGENGVRFCFDYVCPRKRRAMNTCHYRPRLTLACASS